MNLYLGYQNNVSKKSLCILKFLADYLFKYNGNPNQMGAYLRRDPWLRR